MCPTLCNAMDCITLGFPVLTNSQTLLRLMSIELVMPSNHLILCRPLLLPSNFPSIRVISKESVLHIMWPSVGVSASASVLLMNIQDWFPSELTRLIFLQSKGLSRVFSREPINTGHTNQLRWEELRVKRYKVVPGDKLRLSRTLTKLIIHLQRHCLRFL